MKDLRDLKSGVGEAAPGTRTTELYDVYKDRMSKVQLHPSFPLKNEACTIKLPLLSAPPRATTDSLWIHSPVGRGISAPPPPPWSRFEGKS